MKIGILGGSFDPVHFGHLRSAEEVAEALGLDRVRFVPSSSPPHKPGARAEASLRLEMLRAAVTDNPRLEVSDVEIERGGTSFTVDTLETFRAADPSEDLFLILGFDAFRELPAWRAVERIFGLASIVVTARPPGGRLGEIFERFPVAVRDAFCYEGATESYRHESGHVVQYLGITGLDVSSSMIRRARSECRSIRYLVPESVERIIVDRGLYAEEGATV